MKKTAYNALPAYLISYPIKSFSRPVILTSGKTTIGRDSRNTLQIAHGAISHQHAAINYENGHYLLKDLNSKNGTFVNGQRIKKSVLNHHDKISFGNRTFLFLNTWDTLKNAPTGTFPADSETLAISEEAIEPSELLAQTAKMAALELFRQPAPEQAAGTEQASRAHERLSLLYQLSEKLRSTRELDQILNEGLEFILKAIQAADRAMIMLKTDDRGKLAVKAIKNRDPASKIGTIPMSHTVLDWVLTEKMALVSHDAVADMRLESSDSIRIQNSKSLICVPMINKDKVIGILYAESPHLIHPLTQEDAAFSAAVANELALSIENIRLQQEALRNERMAAIGLTITNLAHNIRNMITLNQNAVQLMGLHLRNIEDEGIKKNWRRIQDSFSRINHLSADMLEYASKHQMKLEPINIDKAILSNRDFFEQSLAHKGIELILDLNSGNDKWMMDAKQLQRALLNLVVNAIHAVEDRGKGQITISSNMEDQQRLIVSVSDNGQGIDPQKKDKIFELFYTTKGTSGSGLGLPMVQKFVEQMGGTLDVVSEVGRGSTFKMIFPKHQAW